MFRDNINMFIGEQGLTQKEVADRLGESRQLFHKQLSKNLWALPTLKRLFTTILEDECQIGFEDKTTRELKITEDINELMGKGKLNKAQMAESIGVQRQKFYTKVKAHRFRKDELIRIAEMLGYTLVMCNSEGEIVYRFNGTDLGISIEEKHRQDAGEA